MVCAFGTWKPTPPVTYLLQRNYVSKYFPNNSTIIGDQVFRFMSLRKPFSFEPPQGCWYLFCNKTLSELLGSVRTMFTLFKGEPQEPPSRFFLLKAPLLLGITTLETKFPTHEPLRDVTSHLNYSQHLAIKKVKWVCVVFSCWWFWCFVTVAKIN